MALLCEIDDVGTSEQGSMGVFLDAGVVTRIRADGAVEVDECGMSVCFGVVKNTLNTGISRWVFF